MLNDFLKRTATQQQQQNTPPGLMNGQSFRKKTDDPVLREAIQDVAGLLVGEYYPDKEKFTNDQALVKELQTDLAKLGYNLGTNGVDGKLGAKTKTAMHNFEQDHAEQVKAATEVQETIQNSVRPKDSLKR